MDPFEFPFINNWLIILIFLLEGVPLVYTLSPLSVFEKYFKDDNNNSIIIHEIDNAMISGVEALFDDLLCATQKFNDFKKHVSENIKFVERSRFDEINSKAEAIKISETKLKYGLKNKLIEIRSGISSSIQDVVDNFFKSDCSPRQIVDFIEDNNWLITRFGQITRDQAKGMWRDFKIRYSNLRIFELTVQLNFIRSFS